MNIKFFSFFPISYKLYYATKTYFIQKGISANITHNTYDTFMFYNEHTMKDLVTTLIHKQQPVRTKNIVFDFFEINDNIYQKLLNKNNINNYILLDTTHNILNITNTMYKIKEYNSTNLSYPLFNISDHKVNMFQIIQNIVNDIEYNDFFCFSLYRNLELQILFAILLKKKYPTSRIIAGGLYQLANYEYIVDYFKYFDIEWYFGDVHIVLENLVNNNMFNNMFEDSYDNLPLYSIPTWDHMYVNFSRGCLNNCNYCTGPHIGKYTKMSIHKIEKWLNALNKVGIRDIRVLDNELNLCNDWFDDFLDMLIFNKFKFKLSFFICINKLNNRQIKKLNQLNVVVWCNIDSYGSGVNRKDSFMSLKNAVYLHNGRNEVYLGYLTNSLFITNKQFERDKSYLQFLTDKNIYVCPSDFSLHLNSNFFRHANKFNIDILYYKDMQQIASTEDPKLNNILHQLPIFYQHNLTRVEYVNRRTTTRTILKEKYV